MDWSEEKLAATRIALCEQPVTALKVAIGDFEHPDILYRLIIDVYTHDGYRFPRGLIVKAKQLSKSIPESDRLEGLPEGDILTVYRATITPPEWSRVIKNEPSWTISKEIAIWFAYRASFLEGNNPLNIYTAQISRKKIIAYSNGRHEEEVIQHGNVKNIHLLDPPTDEEIKKAFCYKAGITAENEWYDDAGY